MHVNIAFVIYNHLRAGSHVNIPVSLCTTGSSTTGTRFASISVAVSAGTAVLAAVSLGAHSVTARARTCVECWGSNCRGSHSRGSDCRPPWPLAQPGPFLAKPQLVACGQGFKGSSIRSAARQAAPKVQGSGK